MIRKYKIFLYLTSATLLVSTSSAAASASETEENGENSERPVLGTANPSDAPSDLIVEINGLDRSPTGGLTSLTYTILNEGSEESGLITNFLSESDFYYGASRLGGPSLLDEENQVRYFTAATSEDDCICPRGAGSSIPDNIDTGDSQPAWTTFVLPDDVSTVTVEIPGFEAIEDVPVE